MTNESPRGGHPPGVQQDLPDARGGGELSQQAVIGIRMAPRGIGFAELQNEQIFGLFHGKVRVRVILG